MKMNEYVYFVCQNERRCGLYIDLLMTVRYSHEAWEGHVCSTKLGRVVSVHAWLGLARCGAAATTRRVVNQTLARSSPFHKTGVPFGAQTQLQGGCIYTL